MTNLTKVLTTQFGSLEIDVLKSEQSEPGITREQLGEMLGYGAPMRSIAKIHDRNRERLDPLSSVVNMTTLDKKQRYVTVYNFKGALEVCRFSNQPNAHVVIDLVWEMTDRVRKGELLHSPENKTLQTRLQLAEQKLQLFEEYNEDILCDFDQVAAAMRIYRKPPFGASHLKKWLADRKIICSAHYKNDKPIQRYIDQDWFRLVMHEWNRRGQRRYEPRYLITQRGFNGMVDMAIRERVICLPLPKNYCLPFFDEPLPAEAGGMITVADELGNDIAIEMATNPHVANQL